MCVDSWNEDHLLFVLSVCTSCQTGECQFDFLEKRITKCSEIRREISLTSWHQKFRFSSLTVVNLTLSIVRRYQWQGIHVIVWQFPSFFQHIIASVARSLTECGCGGSGDSSRSNALHRIMSHQFVVHYCALEEQWHSCGPFHCIVIMRSRMLLLWMHAMHEAIHYIMLRIRCTRSLAHPIQMHAPSQPTNKVSSDMKSSAYATVNNIASFSTSTIVITASNNRNVKLKHIHVYARQREKQLKQ